MQGAEERLIGAGPRAHAILWPHHGDERRGARASGRQRRLVLGAAGKVFAFAAIAVVAVLGAGLVARVHRRGLLGGGDFLLHAILFGRMLGKIGN